MTDALMTDLIQTVEQFLGGLERRDFDEIESCLSRDVRFRALVPSGLREGADPSGAIDHFRRWFAGADHFQLLESEVEPSADRLRMRYLIRLHDEDGWALIDQSGYASGNHRIEMLDLVCSGFRPI